MIDAVLHTANREALFAYLRETYPDLVGEGEEGEEMVVGLSATPPQIGEDGSSMVYVRLQDEQEFNLWRDMGPVTVLGWAEFTGSGTGDAVYQMIWDDADAKALYDATYPRPKREVPTGEIEFTVTVDSPMDVVLTVNEWGAESDRIVTVEDSLTLRFFYGAEVSTETAGATVTGPTDVMQTIQAPEKFGLILGA